MALESKIRNKELLSKLTINSTIVYGFSSSSLGINEEISCGNIFELAKSSVKITDISGNKLLHKDLPYHRILAIRDDIYGKEKIKGLEGRYHVLHPKKLGRLREFYTENFNN